MHPSRLTALIFALMLTGVALGEGPPATQPAGDTRTPMAFLTTYDNLAGQGPEAYRALYSTDQNDDTQRLAEVQSKFDAEAGMLQKMVKQLWGDQAEDDVLHALGLKTMRDIQSATIKEEGNRAQVTFADGTDGPDLIKTNAGWRLNLFGFRQALGIPVDDYLKQIRQLSKVIPDIADGIANGKLKSSSAVVSDIAKRLNPQ
jgi:hypothetical protein